jgi:hypothetical protein
MEQSWLMAIVARLARPEVRRWRTFPSPTQRLADSRESDRTDCETIAYGQLSCLPGWRWIPETLTLRDLPQWSYTALHGLLHADIDQWHYDAETLAGGVHFIVEVANFVGSDEAPAVKM